MFDFEYARRLMVDRHLVARGIKDKQVIKAMARVPREKFVPTGMDEFAYQDAPLPIGEGQTISQPYIVAHMIEAARIGPDDRVLEVGAGSGYAAAVMSEIADRVFTIERHRLLGETARERLKALGYDNVSVLISDGTKGWPDEAPFDAIIVAAGAPAVPEALRNQLDIGGRLVIPVAGGGPYQRLLRIIRTSAETFDEDDLGLVLFVPLIGEQGWADTTPPATAEKALPERIAAAMEQLPTPEDRDFGAAFDRFANRRIVLLGEASHGTSEFYRARAAITRRLVQHHGFTVIAVEADWPDAAAVNRHVRGRPKPEGEPLPFRRFPVWMWRNREMDRFLGWLRTHNADRDSASQAGFYGLDLYNMSGSIAAVLAYLDNVDPEAAEVARERYGCLTPWQKEPSTYGRASLSSVYAACEEAVTRQCRDLLEQQFRYAPEDGDDFLDATQNARLVASAEKYYRAMYYGGAAAWNLRDRHMFDTLEHLLEAKGPNAKAVIWAHNSHIGDARATEMGWAREEINIGQLCRERFGQDVASIGFGTHIGTVAAANDWGGEMETMNIRPSLDDSIERCFHLSGMARGLLDLSQDEGLSAQLAEQRLQRFIGVIYRPGTERHSHYAKASLYRQFDAYVWFDRTNAVTALPGPVETGKVPDTFPFGV
jgi:protein-L-isoaspartate(D-aspartate) O-methyltransferase